MMLLFPYKNIHYGYSLEALQWDAFNEYHNALIWTNLTLYLTHIKETQGPIGHPIFMMEQFIENILLLSHAS